MAENQQQAGPDPAIRALGLCHRHHPDHETAQMKQLPSHL
jgi:hypothetical protein